MRGATLLTTLIFLVACTGSKSEPLKFVDSSGSPYHVSEKDTRVFALIETWCPYSLAFASVVGTMVDEGKLDPDVVVFILVDERPSLKRKLKEALSAGEIDAERLVELQKRYGIGDPDPSPQFYDASVAASLPTSKLVLTTPVDTDGVPARFLPDSQTWGGVQLLYEGLIERSSSSADEVVELAIAAQRRQEQQ
jgi:hypothetical protein